MHRPLRWESAAYGFKAGCGREAANLGYGLQGIVDQQQSRPGKEKADEKGKLPEKQEQVLSGGVPPMAVSFDVCLVRACSAYSRRG